MKGFLDYVGPVDLTQYYINSYNIYDDGDKCMLSSMRGNNGVIVDIVFHRRLLNQGKMLFDLLIMMHSQS
jgi:hypothetical protein